MIALGRALAARGHEVTLQTWERWREHVEAEGLTFAPAPEYTVFPQRRHRAAGLLRGCCARHPRHPPARRIARPRCSRRGHPHARPGPRRRAAGHPLRDAHSPRLSAGRAWHADLLARRPPSAHGAWACFVARRSAPAPRQWPAAGAHTAQPDPRTGGPAAAQARPRRHQPRARARGHVPPARVPAYVA